MNKAWATTACLVCLLPSFASGRPVSNKELVKTAVTALFIKRDRNAVSHYWARDYIQHNPNFPSGSGVLESLAKSMPASFKYEMGMVIADADDPRSLQWHRAETFDHCRHLPSTEWKDLRALGCRPRRGANKQDQERQPDVLTGRAKVKKEVPSNMDETTEVYDCWRLF